MSKRDGGYAFPGVAGEMSNDGMSLRDYFAAHCPSDLAKINEESDQEKLVGELWDAAWPIERQIEYNMRVEALLRYLYADAMLRAREVI